MFNLCVFSNFSSKKERQKRAMAPQEAELVWLLILCKKLKPVCLSLVMLEFNMDEEVRSKLDPKAIGFLHDTMANFLSLFQASGNLESLMRQNS